MRRLTNISGQPFARMAGMILSIGAFGFFAMLVATNLSAADAKSLLTQHWGLVMLTLGIYCLAYLPMTMAWILLVRANGAEANGTVLARILLVSQIGKYLPGNIGQFLGRAWMGQQAGVPLRVSARAMALELGGVLAACALLALAALASGLVSAGSGEASGGFLPVILGLASVAALVGAAMALGRDEDRFSFVVPLLQATSLYVGLLLLLAGSNIVLVAVLSGETNWAIAGQVAGAFAVSWLAGFVTPGSPAGLGVREVSFYTLLAGVVPQEILLLTLLAFRLATISGDLIMWLVGIFLLTPAAAGQLADCESV